MTTKLFQFAGRVEFAGAATGPKRFKVVAYTGGAMRLSGFDLPVVVDLQGLIIPPRVVALRDHDMSKPLGHYESVRVEGSNIIADGVLSFEGKDADEFLAASRSGFPWQASIGGTPDDLEHVPAGEMVQANGQTFSGPLYIARKSTLREISLLPLGADGNTAVRLAASMKGSAMTFEAWCESLGIDLASASEETKAALQKAFNSANPPATVAASPVAAGASLDLVASMRNQAAAEAQRQAAIRRLVPDPSLETTITIQGRPQRVNLLAHALQDGWTPEQTELVAMRTNLTADPARTPYGYARSDQDRPGQASILEASMLMSAGVAEKKVGGWYGERVMNEAAKREHRGMGIQGLMRTVIAAAGQHVPQGKFADAQIRAAFQASQQIQAAFTPLSLPGILSNVANKTLLASYESVPTSWQRFCKVLPDVDNFKEFTHYRMTVEGALQEVGPGGEIKHASLDETSFTGILKTYAKMLSLTRQQIINDDLGAFTAIPKALGRMGAIALEKAVYTKLLSNPSNFFGTGNKNYASGGGSALSITSLTTAAQKLAEQLDDNDDPLLLEGKILLCPPAVEATARVLCHDTEIVVAGTTDTKIPNGNPHAGKYEPLSSPFLSVRTALTGASDTGWYLLASPSDFSCLEVAFLRGMQSPTVEDAEMDFNVLGVQFRVYFDFGVGLLDPRGGVFSAGA